MTWPSRRRRSSKLLPLSVIMNEFTMGGGFNWFVITAWHRVLQYLTWYHHFFVSFLLLLLSKTVYTLLHECHPVFSLSHHSWMKREIKNMTTKLCCQMSGSVLLDALLYSIELFALHSTVFLEKKLYNLVWDILATGYLWIFHFILCGWYKIYIK